MNVYLECETKGRKNQKTQRPCYAIQQYLPQQLCSIRSDQIPMAFMYDNPFHIVWTFLRSNHASLGIPKIFIHIKKQNLSSLTEV